MRRFGRLLVEWDPRLRMTDRELASVDEEYARQKAAGKRLVLGTLPSRSGTKWLCDIFSAHANATGTPERNFEAAAFYRYIKYNKLPVDTAGIIAAIKHGIIRDWKKADVALVFSPHFSHGLEELYDALGPERIIFAINDPEFTVQSMYNKGIFSQRYARNDPTLANGYQPALAGSWSQIFGRLVPVGGEYEQWSGLTPIGKLAWWGNMVTMEINRQLSRLPAGVMDVFDLAAADQNYTWYLSLAKDYRLAPVLSERAFLRIKGKRFKASENRKHEWSGVERAEFEQHTKEWAELYRKLSRLHA